MLNPDARIADLIRLGFSQAVIDLSSGRKPHPLFAFCCNDPHYIYHGGTTPFDLTIVPIWEDGTVLTAVLENGGAVEIIQFSLEEPDEYWVVAHTEQGLWAYLFGGMLDGWAGVEQDVAMVNEAARPWSTSA